MTAHSWDPPAMYIVPKADWQSQITRVGHMAYERPARITIIRLEQNRCWVHPRASLSSASLSLTALLSHFGYQMYPMHMLCRVQSGAQPKCSYRISLVNCHSHKHHWDQVEIKVDIKGILYIKRICLEFFKIWCGSVSVYIDDKRNDFQNTLSQNISTILTLIITG